ncbi:hypothetical protein EOD08_37840 [Mesorhizobium sp. M6A.T.Ca.TU.002.02.2.1]|nr:hypothetical protein EOD08_37840 [Mesorhizobium sp. M6A.T.Ca.TU.002.02.2.1]
MRGRAAAAATFTTFAFNKQVPSPTRISRELVAAAGTPSSRAATAPHGQAAPCTIRSGRMPRRSESTPGSKPRAVRASSSSIARGIGGSGRGRSPPE